MGDHRAMTVFSFILGLPMLHSTVAFSAVVSISTIGLYISCALAYWPPPVAQASPMCFAHHTQAWPAEVLPVCHLQPSC